MVVRGRLKVVPTFLSVGAAIGNVVADCSSAFQEIHLFSSGIFCLETVGRCCTLRTLCFMALISIPCKGHGSSGGSHILPEVYGCSLVVRVRLLDMHGYSNNIYY